MCWMFHEYWACGHPSDHHQVFERKCKLYLTAQANYDTAFYRRGLTPSATADLSQCPGNNVTHHFIWDGPFTDKKCWLCTATDTSLIPYGSIIPARLSQNIPMASILHRGIEPVERRPANHSKYQLPPIPPNSEHHLGIQPMEVSQNFAKAARLGQWLETLPSPTSRRPRTQQQMNHENGNVTPARGHGSLAIAEHGPQVPQQPMSAQQLPSDSLGAMASQGQPSQDSLPVWAGFPEPNTHFHYNQPDQQRYGMSERQDLLKAGPFLPQLQMQSSYDPNYSAQPNYAGIDTRQAPQLSPFPTLDLNEARHRAGAEAEADALFQARTRAYYLTPVHALAAGQTLGPMFSHPSQAELEAPEQISPSPHPNTRWQIDSAPAVYLTSPAKFGNILSSKRSAHSPPGSPRPTKARAKRQKCQSPAPNQSPRAEDGESLAGSSRRSLRNRPKISYNEQSSSDEDEDKEDSKPDDSFTPLSTSSSHQKHLALDPTPIDFPQTPTRPPRQLPPQASLLADPQEYSPFASQQSLWGY